MRSLQTLERVLESSWSAIANGVAIDHVATKGVPLIQWVSLADTCLRVGTVHEAMDTIDAHAQDHVHVYVHAHANEMPDHQIRDTCR